MDGTAAMSRSRKGILNPAGRYRDSAPSLGSHLPSDSAYSSDHNQAEILSLCTSIRSTQDVDPQPFTLPFARSAEQASISH
jgi:hypothetical protein